MTRFLRVLAFLALFSCARAAEPAASPEAGIKDFVNTYFTAWSKEDFTRYRACFHPSATVTFQDRGEWKQWETMKFLNDQESLQAQSHFEEVPLAIHIESIHGDTAFVEVPWKLKLLPTAKVVTGIDWYVLVKHDQSWQILNLTFWGDPPSGAQTRQDNPKAKIIVSGFEEFSGRSINASSELARAIREDFPSLDITFLQVPVIWGAPHKAIVVNRDLKPTVWIAFGEGSDDFQIETVADNRRGKFRDNHNALPDTLDIVPGGPANLKLNLPADPLVAQLENRGYTLKVSTDAGGYLCDEMLYSLLREQAVTDSPLKQVVFIHVPVYGTKVRIHNHDVAFSGRNIHTAADDIFAALADNLQIQTLK